MPVTLSKTGCFFRSLPGGIVVRFFEACVCHPVSGAWGSQGHAEHKCMQIQICNIWGHCASTTVEKHIIAVIAVPSNCRLETA